MRSFALTVLLAVALPAASASAQGIESLVAAGAANRSAAAAGAIAAFIASQNDAQIVQVLARPRAGVGDPMGLDQLLDTLASGGRITATVAPVEPVEPVTPPVTRAVRQPTSAFTPFRTGGGGGGGW